MKTGFKIFIIALVLLIGVFTITGCSKEKDNNSTVVLKLNTEGLGQIAYYVNENKLQELSDEEPMQSIQTPLKKDTTVTIEAAPNDGWKFIKWTKDGNEYSKESKVDIKVSANTELIAVFELE